LAMNWMKRMRETEAERWPREFDVDWQRISAQGNGAITRVFRVSSGSIALSSPLMQSRSFACAVQTPPPAEAVLTVYWSDEAAEAGRERIETRRSR
jgi:hypothetical protein